MNLVVVAYGFRVLTRRSFLVLGGTSAFVVLVGGCSSRGPSAGSSGSAGGPGSSDSAIDFSARFAHFEASDEPNGNPSKVVWPDYVTAGGPDVVKLFEFQVSNGELMRFMPCFCGCGRDAGHRNNRDCYIKAVNSDGSVDFDSMAPPEGSALGSRVT